MTKVIVVGSGAGGGTVARELARANFDVTIIERGPFIKSRDAFRCYETFESDVEIMGTVCLGGTTMVTMGNAVRTCEDELKTLGISLDDEFEEMDEELGVKPLPESHVGKGTKKIVDAAQNLGFKPVPMPKIIDPRLCKPCGECAFGCKRDAKWTTADYLEEAVNLGANIIENTPITEIITDNGEVVGVKSQEKEFYSDLVILCAGAISTPRILNRSGVKAGEKLFVDTFLTVGGILKDINFNQEVLMNALIVVDDIILSPHFSTILLDELGKFNAKNEDIIGIMVKIKDDPSGRVTEDSVVKYNTLRDVELLSRGSAIAGSILTEAGVDATTLVSTHPRGAHPGGTAAIGDVVDNNLETKISGLYVSDASVFPVVPGAPPVLTIIALAKRLAKHIIAKNG
ncbi:MAG TPA: FAD-dependent oxidoreductase [Methanobacterium sp.]|nr:FAD-dependent oxidoreductase [Methanobacterium sp.]